MADYYSVLLCLAVTMEWGREGGGGVRTSSPLRVAANIYGKGDREGVLLTNVSRRGAVSVEKGALEEGGGCCCARVSESRARGHGAANM